MPKKLCYVHIGPHKTGTKAIQWFLREQRARLFAEGYFVPESGNIHGGHHAIARLLCGLQVRDRHRSAAAHFAQALAENPCEKVIVSSEALGELLRTHKYATAFFTRLRELDLEPKLVLFPRHQPQWINSRYVEVVKSFCQSDSFEVFAHKSTEQSNLGYAGLVEVAAVFDAKLIVRPFTGKTRESVVPAFLQAIGIDPVQFQSATIRRNEAAGPFSVSVARSVLRLLETSGMRLTWLQAERCKKKVAAYLKENDLADSGYCGLTTEMARCLAARWQADNDAFAQQVWGRPWATVFAADVAQEFTPNDFDLVRPDEETAFRLSRAVREVKALVDEALLDPALAVDAPWNKL